MTTKHDEIIISPFETEKDVEQGYHCMSQAFGAQTQDGFWIMVNPGWDTPEGKAKHTQRLLKVWQSVTTNKDGKPNTVFLKATLPDPDNQGERRVVGIAIWRQLSFVEGYGDPFSSGDISEHLGSFSESDRRFILQMSHSLWKRRIEYMREVQASGRNPPAIFTLDLCTVDPAYQRRGVAGKLVEAGLAEAKARATWSALQRVVPWEERCISDWGSKTKVKEISSMNWMTSSKDAVCLPTSSLGPVLDGVSSTTSSIKPLTQRSLPPNSQPPTMPPIVDIHTHVYPPKYMSLLRSRTTVPYVRTFPDAPTSSRLIILPGEDNPSTPSTSRGRPIGPEYHDISQKIAFMDLHKIDKSVISLANPWLDFLPPEEAGAAAKEINDDVNAQCGLYPGRLYFFATLPLSASTEVIVAEIERLKGLKYARGVIMGTSGLGQGLDDKALDPVYAALEQNKHVIFLHPHYGLPAEVYGPRASEYGHVLPLALGFPLETTIGVTRMLLSGVWDRFANLNVLLAHSGGTLPFLAGRIESCIQHDGHLMKQGKTQGRRDVWDVLKTNIYLDAVVYSEVGLKAALEASGADRLLFGTDHPFFPPLEEGVKEWHSVNRNYEAIAKTFEGEDGKAAEVLGGNAARILGLE
ncbi:uracil-5-carboxylate decarboxylase [Pyrenophora seminiperda CCB06]|uniref:Uracil-5-carboxylate decarboxylase n=1 Tax=Pyrenophora seminiperda CCB06 TaxID=1302712 RepID=A0A3M7M7N0_9PLEO|nr:uracil-5-carboxylate decarboxylase [Pyrenophora seminiperda CCB06]